MKFFKLFTTVILFLIFPISASHAQALGSAFSGMGNNDQPVQIEADKLEIIDDKNTALLTGNVSVVQGTTILKAREIRVYYISGGGRTASGISKIVASGKVAVRSNDAQATAEKATVDMVNEIVTMTGKEVILSQGPNIAKGCKITVNLKTNRSTIDRCGQRVKILLDPKSRNNQ